jgi:hypothetical protein
VHVPPLPGQVGEVLGDAGVERAEQPGPHVDDADGDTQTGEDVRELGRDPVATTTRSSMAFQSTPVTSAPMPNPAARRTQSATSAVCAKILLGMQPRLRQVPPKVSASMIATGPWPGSSGIRRLPEPDPMIAREKCRTLES